MTTAPSSVAGFTVEARVTGGALASVYRARRGSRLAAIKIYPAGRAGLERLERRVQREHEAQARVNHPSVARLLDWGLLPDGSAFLASEWIEGARLEDRLSRGPLSWEELHPIVRALGEGLGAIHAVGVVHRDVKPANLILPAAGRPAAVLLDFGHSLLLSEERVTDRGLVLGSASYMAPEQAAGLVPDGRADLYSLGVVIYRALCGVLPFESRSPAEVLRQHLHQPVVPPRRRAPERGIPAVAEDLCLWLMTKSREARLPNARVLGITLAALRKV